MKKTVNAFKRNIAKNEIKVQFSMYTFKKYEKKEKSRKIGKISSAVPSKGFHSRIG